MKHTLTDFNNTSFTRSEQAASFLCCQSAIRCVTSSANFSSWSLRTFGGIAPHPPKEAPWFAENFHHSSMMFPLKQIETFQISGNGQIRGLSWDVFGDVWFSAVPKLITVNIIFGVSLSRTIVEDTTSTVMSSQPKRVFIWFDEFGRETSLFGSPNVRHTLCYTSGHVSLAAKAHPSSPNPQQASSFKGSHIFHMRKPRQIWMRSIQLLIKIHT